MGDVGVAAVPSCADDGTLPGVTVLRDADVGSGSGTVVLGDLAQSARVVPADVSLSVVDGLMRADLTLRWLVLDGPEGPTLLTRGWLERVVPGRFGYGRLHNRRRRARDVAPLDTVVLPADSTIGHAAAVVTERGGGADHLIEAVVVFGPGGTIGVAPAAAVFEQLARHYAHQALHDPLTGLPNRLFLSDSTVPRAPGRSPVLLYIDLDRFKDVNDDLGHAAGDEVLVQFADRLRGVARAEDLVVRLAGDEFALVAAGPIEREQADRLAERVMLAAATPFVVGSGEPGRGEQLVTLGASVGIASGEPGTCTAPGNALEALLTRADMAMYRAKSLGRGRSAHYDPELQADHEAVDAVRARHRMERRLRAAISAGRLHLQYQPVVGLPSGRVTGAEALARWHDDELGWVPPDVFVPLAERSGLVIDLGRWVLRTACQAAATWPAGVAAAAPTVAVNVSPVQLAQRGFVDDVVAALAESGLAAERLCLEITETAAITDLVATAVRLEELRALGVRLALDDFGAGHSALALLRRLPVDLVKIDRSFVERVASDTADAVLVRLVIEAAHSLGRRVCAEGVETSEQAQQLVAMGCDSAQGWLFGRAEPAGPGLLARLTGGTGHAEVDGTPALPLHGTDELIIVSAPDRTISYASAASGPLLGRLPQELVGTSVLDLLHPADRRRMISGDLLRAGIDGEVHRVVHPDGGVRWLRTATRQLADQAGAVREVLSVSRDVTASVEAEIALADSEAMFRHAFDDAPIGMALTGLDGGFIRVNKAFAALLGRSSEEIGKSSVQELTHPDDLAADDANLGELLDGTASVHDVPKRYLHADGSAVPVVVHAAVVHDAEGAPAHVFAHVLPQ